MSHTPHELSEEFPEAIETIHELKTADAHFAKLADEYHEVNREIHRIETRTAPASEVYEEELRKRRLLLKDEIASRIKAA